MLLWCLPCAHGVLSCARPTSLALQTPRRHVAVTETHHDTVVRLQPGNLCDVRRDLVFPLGRLHFKGVPISVPGNVTGVLTHRYGDDFMVPKYMDKGRDSIEQGGWAPRMWYCLYRACEHCDDWMDWHAVYLTWALDCTAHE